MFKAFARKIFGSKNERYLRSLTPFVERVNMLEPQMQALSDREFPSR
jgi:preprotein translocase subunit SecA